MTPTIAPRVLAYIGADNMVDGKLPSWAWPGGYPLFYIAGDCTILCPAHANVEDEYDNEPITDADVNWEDTDLWCEHGHLIESAYGDTPAARTDPESGRPLCSNPKCPLASTLYGRSVPLCAYCLGDA